MIYLTEILSFLVSLFVTSLSIPVIIRIAKAKRLLDEPNQRTSHYSPKPTLGGLGVIFGFVLSMLLFVDFTAFPQVKYILASLVIISAIGIKDDIIIISVFFKATGLFIASAIVVVFADIRVKSLYGIFGVFELPYTISVLFSIFLIVAIVNSYNFIDGINGLAASLSLIACVVYGSWFVLNPVPVSGEMAIIASAVIGGIVGFLGYNVNPAKIFLGDTGSLVLGFIVAVLTIEYLNQASLPTTYSQSPFVAVSVVLFPLVDMLKVIVLRLLLGRSPFHPDKNHLHHLLLRIGLSHAKTTIILSICSVISVFLVHLAQSWKTAYLLILLIFMAVVISTLPYFIIMKKEHKSFSIIVN